MRRHRANLAKFERNVVQLDGGIWVHPILLCKDDHSQGLYYCKNKTKCSYF